MKLTIEDIKAAQENLSKMIDKFEQQQKNIKFGDVQLQENEKYAGVILNENGEPSHHLILLGGNIQNGKRLYSSVVDLYPSLPTIQELSLLYCNLKTEFYQSIYLSSNGSLQTNWCWCIDFENNQPKYTYKPAHVCQVRRVQIEPK
jgi:hypothetical protein